MKPIVFSLATLIAFAFTSCESAKYAADFDGVSEVSNSNGGNYKFAFGDASTYGAGNEVDSDADGVADKEVERKITYTASIGLYVETTDSMVQKIDNVAKQYKGYLSSSTHNSATIKVIADSIKPAIAEIEKLGEVRYSNLASQDVTDQYTDLQLRLDNALAARKRYLELLEKAETVEEALLVEKELERLNLTIERLKGTINQLDDRLAYSTITVYFNKKYEEHKTKPGILGYVFVGLYKGIKWLFVRG